VKDLSTGLSLKLAPCPCLGFELEQIAYFWAIKFKIKARAGFKAWTGVKARVERFP